MTRYAEMIIPALAGGFLTFITLWLTVQPVSAKDVHEYVHQYVRLTVERRLDNIEDSLKGLRQGQVELQKGLASVEAVFRFDQ